MDRILEASRMVEAFLGAGAHSFDLTRTTIGKRGVPGGFERAVSPSRLRERLPGVVEASLHNQVNVIVRPHIRYPSGFLQLDDIAPEMLEQIRPLAFLTLATSTYGRQAWVQTEGCDTDFRRRVKKAAGADLGASGWVRLAGTLNVKLEHEPLFPTVKILATLSRPPVGPEDFRELDLVAPVDPHDDVRQQRTAPRCSSSRPRRFPDYAICLAKAPAARTHEGQDRSLADHAWCCAALRWGWSPEEAAARLLAEQASKAHERGWEYAIHTAEKAARAVAGVGEERF